MQAFIDQPVESILLLPPRTDVTHARSPSLIRRLGRASYVVKAYRWLKWRLGVGPAFAAPAEEGPDESSLEWRYTKKAIAYMQYVAAKHGAQLVIVPISPFGRRDHEILRRTAKVYGLPFLDTSAFTVADASLWLPRDSHYPAGARRMAELLAEYARPRK